MLESVLKPKFRVLGADFAGRVVAIGQAVQNFQVGDEVYGEAESGSFAEFVSVPEVRLAHKPLNLSFQEAAAVPMAALTAYKGIRKDAKIEVGDKVLINGASGGVGTFAVQIAKAYGAIVTAVCSTRNLALVKSLGADEVIDYTQTPVDTLQGDYDFVIDTIGNLDFPVYRSMLKVGGKGIVIGMKTFGKLLKVMLLGKSWYGRKGPKIYPMMPNENFQDLRIIKEMIESELVKPVIDQVYTLEQVPKGIQYLERGRSRGKNVVTIGSGA